MHDLRTAEAGVECSLGGTSGGTGFPRQCPVGFQNKLLDCREVVSRSKVSVSHRHLNCLVPHQFGPYTFITTSEKPRELVIAEGIRRLPQQDELTYSLPANDRRNAGRSPAVGW